VFHSKAVSIRWPTPVPDDDPAGPWLPEPQHRGPVALTWLLLVAMSYTGQNVVCVPLGAGAEKVGNRLLSKFRHAKKAGPARLRFSRAVASAHAVSPGLSAADALIGLDSPTRQRSTASAARDDSVDTIRGIAVILMVAGHVIGDSSTSGMSVPDDSGWHHAYLSLQWLRMPLFTVISGYVYDLRPIRAGATAKFAQGKVRRLLVPYFFVSTLFVLIQSVVPGVHGHLSLTALPGILVNPYAHFWYLYALAWVFFVVGVADRFGGLSTVRRWAVGLGIAIVLSGSSPFGTPIFAIAQTYYLLPYFLLGVGLHRYGALLNAGRTLFVVFPLLVIGVLLHEASLFDWWEPTELQGWLLTTFLGMIGTVALLRIRFSWRPLARIGAYSYGIYLLHVFGTAGARIGLYRVGIGAKGTVFVVALVAGVLLPILFELAIDQVPVLRLLMLGKSPRAGIAQTS